MTPTAATCAQHACLSIATAGGYCARHTAERRRAAGLCANCGSPRAKDPVINDLTGKQARRYGRPLWQMRCLGCGRTQRPATDPEAHIGR